jgi:hypothetical protein
VVQNLVQNCYNLSCLAVWFFKHQVCHPVGDERGMNGVGAWSSSRTSRRSQSRWIATAIAIPIPLLRLNALTGPILNGHLNRLLWVRNL